MWPISWNKSSPIGRVNKSLTSCTCLVKGLAYALPNGDVFIHNKWKSKKYGAITKPKTQILLNEEGNCVAFGIDASDVYSQLDQETQ